MCILLLSFTAYYQAWANTFLAANRFCAIALPMLYESVSILLSVRSQDGLLFRSSGDVEGCGSPFS